MTYVARPHGGGDRRNRNRTASETVELTEPKERAFLIAVDTGKDAGWTGEESLEELAQLVEAAGGEVVGRLCQRRPLPDPVTYLGKGKCEELLAAKQQLDFDLLVADDELTPKQQRGLERLLDVRVIDRTEVILDIFADRARTHEGRLQVELAQLEYQLPRLRRMWTHLSRLGGGIGARRGPGETQLEVDRRVLKARIKKLKERVDEVAWRRATAARARESGLLPTVTIVGYTNAGKSTLLNALVGDEVALAEDKLFATLDPTTRRVKLGEGQTVIMSDTVGFIHKLPHQLVQAFRATLEEVSRADALLVVVDQTDPHAREHLETVWSVLSEIGAASVPRLIVLNKIDLPAPESTPDRPCAPLPWWVVRDAVRVSALTGEGLPELRHRLAAIVAEPWTDIDVAVSYASGEVIARARERGTVTVTYEEDCVRVRGRVPPTIAAELTAAARLFRRSQRSANG